MNRRARTSIIALILFAGYALVVVIGGIVGSGDGAAFRVPIGAAVVPAAAALWVARWIYRRRGT